MFDYGSIWACTFFYLFYVNEKAFLRINVGSTVALNACNSCSDIFSGKLPPPTPPPPKLTLTLTSRLGQNDRLGEG